MQSGRQLTKIEEIIESWGLEVPKETAGKRLVAKIHIFAAVFECQLGVLARKKSNRTKKGATRMKKVMIMTRFPSGLGCEK